MQWLALNRRSVLLLSSALLLNGCISNTPTVGPTQTAGILPTKIQAATVTPSTATPAPTLPVLSSAPTSPPVPTAAVPLPSAVPTIPVTVPGPAVTEASEAPVITSFTADHFEVKPGETITLSWVSQGATTADISAQYFQVGSTEILAGSYNVSPTGALSIRMPDVALRQASFNLHVSTPANEYSNQTVFVHSPCVAHYFFPFPASWQGAEFDNCPDQGAKTVQAIQQDFERGRMIWLPPDPGGASQPQIAVLAGSGAEPEWITYCLNGDIWQAGEPESDPAITPPAGYYQPVRGFGKLWRDGLRDQLGWALTPEQSYFAQVQVSDAVWSPYNDSYIYISTADSRTVVIHCVRLILYWRYVPDR